VNREQHNSEAWRAALETADFTHLSYEQIAVYVDQAADEVEREIVASHLAVCPHCAAELQQMQAARAELLPYPVREPERKHTPTLWEKFSELRPVPAWRWLLPATSAVAAALLFWLGSQIWSLNRENRELRARLSAFQQEHSRLQQQTAEAGKTAEDLRQQLAQLQSENAAALLALNDAGGKVTLDPQGNIAGLGTLAPAQQRLLKDALTSGRVEQSALAAELAGKSDSLLGGGKAGVAFALVNPVGKIVATDRPTLRWQPLAGATGYTVAIYDENLRRVAASELVTAASWTVTPPLVRGQVFTWQVRALKDGREVISPTPPAPEARFKVLEQARLNELNQAKRAQPNSHLLLGLLYAKAGLIDEAERELQTLARLNPNSELARKLWQSVKVTRRSQ
jgi:tetratricopeptide (TPR) repeat protein